MSKQERATRTRNALILSAARLFERHGYTKTSLDDISNGAGVSRGALHFHFENKAAIANAVEQSATQALHQTANDIPHHSNSLQTLIDLTHHLNHLLHQNTTVRAGFRLNTDTTPHTTHNLRQQWHTCIHQLITRAATQNTLNSNIHPDHLTTTIVATTTGLEVLSRTNQQWLAPAPLTTFWELLLPTITAPTTRSACNPHGTDDPHSEGGIGHDEDGAEKNDGGAGRTRA
ncbi:MULTISPECIES: ScbR family autoregulator-binding transcription factor [unclassified Streptomyces]|uniref:ScbR family autoregulator-binding transcription factor n=1 Tax=unclassified Streptomyces TaxID=2593676 RepID=UPI0033E4F316